MAATLAPPAAPIAELLRIERGAPAPITRVWGEVIHDAFDGSLTCWPTLPRDRGRAVEAISHSVATTTVYIALDGAHQVLGVAFAGERLLHFENGGLQQAYGELGARWRLSVLGYLGMRRARSGVVALEGFAVDTVQVRYRRPGLGELIVHLLDGAPQVVPVVAVVVGQDSLGGLLVALDQPGDRRFHVGGTDPGKRRQLVLFQQGIGHGCEFPVWLWERDSNPMPTSPEIIGG